MNRYKNKEKAAQTYAKLKPDLNGIRSIYTVYVLQIVIKLIPLSTFLAKTI